MLYRSVLYSEQTWHTFCYAVYTKLLTATQYSSEYLFIMLMFSSIKSQSQYKKSFYVSFSCSFSTCPFQPFISSGCFRNSTKQPARCKQAPRTCILMARMFLTRKSSNSMSIPTPTQTHASNIDNADIIMRQIGKTKFGVMKLSMWMICNGSSS
jgi:hypothetical protein